MTNEGYLNHILTFFNNIKWAVEADKAHMENHRKKNGISFKFHKKNKKSIFKNIENNSYITFTIKILG